MTLESRLLRLLFAILALSLVAAACGSDDDDPGADTDPLATSESDGDEQSGLEGSDSDGGGGEAAASVDFADVLAAAPVASDLPDSPTIDAIVDRGRLIVGGSQDAPLLSQLIPGTDEYEGFDAYMGQLLAKYILGDGAEREILTSATETREALLQNGTVDVVFQTYTITPERAEQVNFAGPYYESGLAIMAPEDTDITGPEDLNGLVVIAGANTPAIPAIEELAPDAEIVTFGTAPEALEALRQGRGDAYVQDLAILIGDGERHPELKIIGDPFTVDPYGIGISLEDDAFKAFVNDWLLLIQEQGIWADAWRASIGTVVKGNPPTPPILGSAEGS